MNLKLLYEDALLLQAVLGLISLCIMGKRRVVAVYPYVACLLTLELVSTVISIPLMYYRVRMHLTLDTAYSMLFATSWVQTGLGLILRTLVVYGVFSEAMRPLSGLHAAGKIVFRWVGVVSALVATALLAGPGVFSGTAAWLNVFGHLQQGVGVLTLCLLIFVCFTIRPLGLTFRSHLFGVSLGLGIAATVDLIQAAWLLTTGAPSVYSPIFLFSSVGTSVSYLVWTIYFAAPEPERRMILLPTTSPCFFWNRISEILGDAPGQVAVAGFTPGMLAPAELEMLTAAPAPDPSTPLSDSAAPALPRREPSVLSGIGKAWYTSPAS